MKRARFVILAALLLPLLLLPGTAQAHGSCDVSIASWQVSGSGNEWRGEGDFNCTTSHDETWIQVTIERKQGAGSWNVWHTANDHCTTCNHTGQHTQYYALCAGGWTYRVHVEGWQVSSGGNVHNQDDRYSTNKGGTEAC